MTEQSCLQHCASKFVGDIKSCYGEIVEECNPKQLIPEQKSTFNLKNYIHIPYLPPFHQPGWLMRYILGPYDKEWSEMLLGDFQAGITVIMTLIPYGLSQATLATLPPVYGLYTALVPGATYSFFGSSMQLTVGPTALISLLTGNLMSKYGVDSTDDLYLALDTAAQAAFCVGIIIAGLGILNLGNLIQFMSYPVMSGFTTGAAMTIGLTQLKNAFGFLRSPPNAGGTVDYNYEVMQWWTQNYHQKDDNGDDYINSYAVKICFGLYIPLIFVQMFKWWYKPPAHIKNSVVYKLIMLFLNLLPLIAIIIGAGVAYHIKKDPNRTTEAVQLKVVGEVPSGINVGRIPVFHHPMGQFFVDVLPLTLIAFMESYSIARNMAAAKNQVHLLSASQEMFANGAANLLASVTSGYPVSGSFSRSALNITAGARSPLSVYVTIACLLICLSTLTKALKFIPNAALATVIFIAISNIMNMSDLWLAWKHSKKDFFVMLVTITFVFVFDTSIGLAVGLGTSVIVYCVFDIILAKSHIPRLFTSSRDSNDVDVVRIESDLNFLTAYKIKDFITSLTVLIPKEPEVSNKNELIRFHVSHLLDTYLKPNLLAGVEKLPKAIVVDFCIVKTIDLSGLESMATAFHEVRSRGVLIVYINATPEIESAMMKFGIKCDESTNDMDFKEYEDAYRLDLWTVQDKYAASRPVDTEAGKRKHFQEFELVTVPQNATIVAQRGLSQTKIQIPTPVSTPPAAQYHKVSNTDIEKKENNEQL